MLPAKMKFWHKSFSRILASFPLTAFMAVSVSASRTVLSQTYGKEKDIFLVLLFLWLSYSLAKNVICTYFLCICFKFIICQQGCHIELLTTGVCTEWLLPPTYAHTHSRINNFHPKLFYSGMRGVCCFIFLNECMKREIKYGQTCLKGSANGHRNDGFRQVPLETGSLHYILVTEVLSQRPSNPKLNYQLNKVKGIQSHWAKNNNIRVAWNNDGVNRFMAIHLKRKFFCTIFWYVILKSCYLALVLLIWFPSKLGVALFCEVM